MKNKLFGKATALVMGSLIIFSGQALAISSNNNRELNNAEAWGESELLIAQAAKGSLKDIPTYAVAVSKAETTLGDALAVAESQAIGGSKKNALAKAIADAQSLIGDATAISGSNAKSDKAAAAFSLSKAETVLGDALAIAQSDAVSGPGKPALATALSGAKTAVGNAAAIARASAESG